MLICGSTSLLHPAQGKKKAKEKGLVLFSFFFFMFAWGRRFHTETQKYAVFEENGAELAK